MRAKRQATIIIFNDDNENPFTPRQTRAKVRDVESMELDGLADIPAVKTDLERHNGASGRVALSPAKIKTHFNTVKTGSSEYPQRGQDSGKLTSCSR